MFIFAIVICTFAAFLAGPEILQRFVGQSEENMRDLFAPAEKEFKGKGDKSQLHVIIFDEIDAIMVGGGGRLRNPPASARVLSSPLHP